MILSFTALADPAVWFGTTGIGALGFVTGHLRSRAARSVWWRATRG